MKTIRCVSALRDHKSQCHLCVFADGQNIESKARVILSADLEQYIMERLCCQTPFVLIKRFVSEWCFAPAGP